MSKLVLYLLEASAALAILYSLYLLLLRNETFFSLNRFFLLAIPAFSLLFPFLNFDLPGPKSELMDKPIKELKNMRTSYYDALQAWSTEGRSSIDEKKQYPLNTAKEQVNIREWVLHIFIMIYGIGAMAMLFRLAWTYAWMHRLKVRHPSEIINGVVVVKIPTPMAPFSFLNSVFVHKDILSSEEFAQILAHEKTHIQEKHSFDLIFVQLLAAFLWFNPVVWLLIKSLKTTHEYIADKKIIQQGYSLVEYQSLLLRQLISNNSFGLVHNFNLSFIKKRITMMKIKESGWAGKTKAAFALSLVMAFSLVAVQCNSKFDEAQQPETKALSDAQNQEFSFVLPTVPQTVSKFDQDFSNALEVLIIDDNLRIDGKAQEVSEIASVIENYGLPESGIIVMKIHKDQPMAMVRNVHWELRKANRRKLLYLGETTTGERTAMPFLLPPDPENLKPGVPKMPSFDLSKGTREGDVVTLGNTEILAIDLGNQEGFLNQDKVDRFVRSHIQRQSSDYVVSATFGDDDIYGDYLRNLTYIQEGFNQIYDERAKKMYGKSFWELDKHRSSDAWSMEAYRTVRKGVPRAISVAEK